MWVGLVALLVAVAAAGALALYRRRVDGRFRTGSNGLVAADRISSADIGATLGRHATVVQFSSELCAPCRAAERVITEAVDGLDGVRYVDLDSEQRLDLVRRFNILRTPTVLVTDGDGRVVARTAGVPSRQALKSALPAGARS